MCLLLQCLWLCHPQTDTYLPMLVAYASNFVIISNLRSWNVIFIFMRPLLLCCLLCQALCVRFCGRYAHPVFTPNNNHNITIDWFFYTEILFYSAMCTACVMWHVVWLLSNSLVEQAKRKYLRYANEMNADYRIKSALDEIKQKHMFFYQTNSFYRKTLRECYQNKRQQNYS